MYIWFYVCMYVCIVCMDVFLSLIAYPSIQLLSLQVCFNKFSLVCNFGVCYSVLLSKSRIG